MFAPRVFEVGGLTAAQIQAGAGYAQPIARLKPGVSLEQAQRELAAIEQRLPASSSRDTLDANNTSEPRMFVAALVGNLAADVLHAARRGRLRAADRLRQRRVAVPRPADGAAEGNRGAAVARRDAARRSSASSWSRAWSSRWSPARCRRAARDVGAVRASSRWSASQLPPNTTLTLNWRALPFTGGVTLVSAAARRAGAGARRRRARDWSKRSRTAPAARPSARGGRFRCALIVAEVALSVVLLVGSSLLLVSFLKLQRTPPGFDPKGAAAAFVGVPPARYHDAGAAGGVLRAGRSSGCARSPGVTDAAAAIGLPLSGFNAAIAVQRRRPARSCRCRSGRSRASAIVSDDYFRLMRISLRGRPRLHRATIAKARRGVCIINESLATRLFPGESALGKALLRGRDAEHRGEIVGVIHDVKTQRPQRAGAGRDLLPDAAARRARAWTSSRDTAGDPAALQAVDPRAPSPRSTRISRSRSSPRSRPTSPKPRHAAHRRVADGDLRRARAGAVGGRPLFGAGVRGRRSARSEIGIRMALGAQAAQVVGLMMRSGLELVAIGLVLGLAGAAGAARLIQTLLFDVRPLDPIVYAGVAVLFTVVAALACLLPSLRASRIDPLIALRSE